MAGLRITAFSGMAPRLSKFLLKENEAQMALNTSLSSGELRAWRRPGSVTPAAQTVAGAQSIYRHLTGSGDVRWLSWASDVNVVPSPVYALNEYPIYLTGNGTPKKTNATLQNTSTYLEMGVPNPTVAPTVNVTGGSGTAESRVYLYTYISEFGTIQEESGPSPASDIATVLPGATVTVNGLPAAAPVGAYNITKVRIYRQVTGTQSNAYLKVADVNIGTTSYVDSVTASGLGQVLPSAAYEPPPTDLQGLTSMANGILAGFRGNEVYFSEPYQPHAWPSIYSLTVEFEIVGIAAFGESLVVATEGNPFVITGSTPAAMSQTKLPMYEPCVSKRSVVADRDGAMYASPNGVVKISQGFSGVITKNLMTRDEWQVYGPATMNGAVLDGSYYLFFDTVNSGAYKGAVILDGDDANQAMTLTNMHTTAVHVEPTTASMYVVEDNEVKLWEGDPLNYLPYEWTSKVFVTPRPVNFGAVQVEAEYGDIQIGEALDALAEQIQAENQITYAAADTLLSELNVTTVNFTSLNGSILQDVPSAVDGRFVLLQVYCNSRLVATLNITSRRALRLPSGFKGDRWEFRLAGNVPLRSLKVAETSKELVQL